MLKEPREKILPTELKRKFSRILSENLDACMLSSYSRCISLQVVSNLLFHLYYRNLKREL